MAFNPAPSAWFPTGYSLGTNQIIFNTSNHGSPALPDVSNTDGNATTGDIREVMHGICEAFAQAWNAIDIADRPGKMMISRTSSEDSDGNLQRNFYFQFTVDVGVLDVVAE